MMGQMLLRQVKKALVIKAFTVELDAPYRARTCDP